MLFEQTRRSLFWAGCLVVGGLGLLFLPPASVQAQAPKDDPYKAAPAEKESVDQQIEILKKAIMILEQQKAGDKAKATPKQADPAELKKAEEDVAAVAKEMEVKRGELKALEQKHAMALDRLAKLKGGQVDKALGKYYIQWTKTLPKQPAMLHVYQDMVKQKPELLLKETIKKKVSPESLEQKLDRLMKEIEELRRDIKQQKSPKGAFVPAQPSADFTVPTSLPANAIPPSTPAAPASVTIPASPVVTPPANQPAPVTPTSTPSPTRPAANTVPTTPAKN